MLICIITQSVDLVFVISWVSLGLDSVTVSQPWLIALAWPWLYQISHKPHPILINIVKVLQCHQISTFWCVINSSGCIIDKWKHKSMTEKIFHNPANMAVISMKNLEYFMESAGIQFTHKLLTYQKSYKWGQWTSEISYTKASVYIPNKALSMWCCVYFTHTETFIILEAFF